MLLFLGHVHAGSKRPTHIVSTSCGQGSVFATVTEEYFTAVTITGKKDMGSEQSSWTRFFLKTLCELSTVVRNKSFFKKNIYKRKVTP